MSHILLALILCQTALFLSANSNILSIIFTNSVKETADVSSYLACLHMLHVECNCILTTA